MATGSAISESAAFVPGFGEDIFISYGHIDNPALDPWVERLHTWLEERVPQILGENIRIWRDRKLNGNDALWDVLHERIQKSAIFLSVLSPRYVKSKACRDEAATFAENAKKNGGIKVGNTTRIFRVLKTPYPLENEPPSFKEIESLGFRFFETEKQNPAAFHEFTGDRYADPENYPAYRRECEKLAQNLASLLGKMRDNAEAAKPEAAAAPAVFVAFVTADRLKDRLTIINTLTGKGLRVVPSDSEALPQSAADLDAIIDRDIAGCTMAIHLMGSRYGAVPEDAADGKSLIQQQYERIREKGLAKQSVWIPEDLSAAQPAQVSFLSSIENSGDDKCEIIKTGFWAFIGAVIEQLAKPPAKPKRDSAPSVFFLCDKADLDRPLRKQIRSYLIDQGFPVLEPAFQGDPSLLREIEQANMRESGATLIYYGSATDAWVDIKRRTLLRELGNSENGRKHVRALYLCQPEDEYKRGHYLEFAGRSLPEGSGFCPLLVLGDCQQFAPEKLAPLIGRLDSLTGGC